ncbi:hypothetical protein DPMN_038400 [Dreissena polymorpha]|uniref:Uncharacterized protein n=1 Tax=Dreissena polymorpha TaxID=45954 RepID=A0A9D4MCN4_DREPO|nr:hypothetical protein DPMN_038400 [Dreissena polymorpha]
MQREREAGRHGSFRWKSDAEDFHHSRCERCLERWAPKEESGRLQYTPLARQLNEHPLALVKT